jgi:hypothetical protein
MTRRHSNPDTALALAAIGLTLMVAACGSFARVFWLRPALATLLKVAGAITLAAAGGQ